MPRIRATSRSSFQRCPCRSPPQLPTQLLRISYWNYSEGMDELQQYSKASLALLSVRFISSLQLLEARILPLFILLFRAIWVLVARLGLWKFAPWSWRAATSEKSTTNCPFLLCRKCCSCWTAWLLRACSLSEIYWGFSSFSPAKLVLSAPSVFTTTFSMILLAIFSITIS